MPNRGPKMRSLNELPLKRVGVSEEGKTIYVLEGELDSVARLSLSHLGIVGPRVLKPVGGAVTITGYLGRHE